jgi:hypothetical protein
MDNFGTNLDLWKRPQRIQIMPVNLFDKYNSMHDSLPAGLWCLFPGLAVAHVSIFAAHLIKKPLL